MGKGMSGRTKASRLLTDSKLMGWLISEGEISCPLLPSPRDKIIRSANSGSPAEFKIKTAGKPLLEKTKIACHGIIKNTVADQPHCMG